MCQQPPIPKFRFFPNFVVSFWNSQKMPKIGSCGEEKINITIFGVFPEKKLGEMLFPVPLPASDAQAR